MNRIRAKARFLLRGWHAIVPLLFVMWFTSRWFTAQIVAASCPDELASVSIHRGAVTCWWITPFSWDSSIRHTLRTRAHWNDPQDRRWTWWYSLERRGGLVGRRTSVGALVVVTLPLWPLVVLPATLLGFLWWRSRQRNVCPLCHYSRAGLPDDSPCPECGAPAARSDPHAAATAGGAGSIGS